jgi:hypothetical protein
MDAVIDLTEATTLPPVLTQTSTGGVLGGALLADDPAESYLKGTETPQYAVRNKKAGIVIETADSERQIQPADSYQTVAVVTDQRLIMLVGDPDGDERVTVPLVDVTQARAEQGRRKATLILSTQDGTTYRLKATADLRPVARYVDETAQAWVRAYRLLDDATADEAAARDELANNRFKTALERAKRAAASLEDARTRLASLGGAVNATFSADARGLERCLHGLERQIYAAKSRYHHETARALWEERSYERAYDEYGAAMTAAEQATGAEGTEPPAAELETFAQRLAEEKRELAADPLASAQQLSTAAASMDAAAPAAARWETVIRRYQDVLSLDWGREQRRFAGDQEMIQEAIIDAVANLVATRRAAASDCRAAASAHEQQGSPEAARDAYRTAIAHLERAQSISAEMTPSRETGLQDSIEAVRRELEAVPASSQDGAGGAGSADPDLPGAVATHLERGGWEPRQVDGGLIARQKTPFELVVFISLPETPDSAPKPDGRGASAARSDAGETATPSARDRINQAQEHAAAAEADLTLVGVTSEHLDRCREAATDADLQVYDLTLALEGDMADVASLRS